jgi:hypothetical protein
MDGVRFDAIARLWRPGSRRRVVRLLVGGALGAAAPALVGSRGAKAGGCGADDPPCDWPNNPQLCCNGELGYVCMENFDCCLPGWQPCGGDPNSWACCCDPSAGQTCNPNFTPDGEEPCCQRCQIKTVKLWVKAFIPLEVYAEDGTTPVTLAVPDGPYAGQTMLPGPTPVNDCFLTDQRFFSGDLAAQSRTHSEVTINLRKKKVSEQEHGCSPTHEIDCEDGSLECEATGRVQGKKFYGFRATGGRQFTVFFRTYSSNPCFTGAPDIDCEGRFRIELNNAKDRATISFTGKVDRFPAFEAYASVNDGPGQAIFQHLPAPGDGPDDLFGRASEPVSGSVEVSC